MHTYVSKTCRIYIHIKMVVIVSVLVVCELMHSKKKNIQTKCLYTYIFLKYMYLHMSASFFTKFHKNIVHKNVKKTVHPKLGKQTWIGNSLMNNHPKVDVGQATNVDVGKVRERESEWESKGERESDWESKGEGERESDIEEGNYRFLLNRIQQEKEREEENPTICGSSPRSKCISCLCQENVWSLNSFPARYAILNNL